MSEVAARLEREVRALARPEGREVGGWGHEQARRYLRERLDALGFRPYGDRYELPYVDGSRGFVNLVGVAPGDDPGAPPFHLSPAMGSLRFQAEQMRRRVRAMFALDLVGHAAARDVCRLELAGPWERYDTTPLDLRFMRAGLGEMLRAWELPLEGRRDIDRIVRLIRERFGL